jgi:heptosyltransferase-2
MRILLIQTAHAGDALLASSLLADLSERYPLAALDVLVRRGNEALFAHNPRVSRVWSWDKQGSKLRNLWKLGNALRAERFDRVYNLQRFASSGFLTWRSGAPFRAGFAQNPWSRFFHHTVEHRIPWPDPSAEGQYLHEVQRNRFLLDERLETPRRPEIYPTDAHRKSAEDLIGSAADRRPLIVLAPGSRWATKRWPVDKWAALLQELPDTIRVVLVGGPEDRAAAKALLEQHPQCINACGEADVNTTAALMDRAWHVFANDSLGIHLASAVNAPSTLVYCSTGPELGFFPLSEAGRWAKAPVECCEKGLHGAKACKAGHFQCAQALEPSAVLEPLLPRWAIALRLRQGQPIRLSVQQNDGQIKPWIMQLATHARSGEGQPQSPSARKGAPQSAYRPVDAPLLWFADLQTLERQMPSMNPTQRRILMAHFRIPFARRACLRMEGLQGLPEGMDRLPFGLGGSPEWTALLRCVDTPVLLTPASAAGQAQEGQNVGGEGALLEDALPMHAPLRLPAAQLCWSGGQWTAEHPGDGTEDYMPWVKTP